jgi:protein-disulfide isomerase
VRPLSRRSALAAGLALAALPGAAAHAVPGVAAPGDMSLGNAKARIKVVEYASLSCSHCAAFNEQTFPAFKKKYIDTGRVQYTIKELLTPPAQLAVAGFLMARCAGPSKYFKVVDEVFRSQAGWKEGADIRGMYVAIAKANGLTEAQFEACIQDKAAQAALGERVKRSAEQDGVDSTPTFFVNGVKVASPDIPTLAELDAAIAAAAGRR